jgi:hypothetical protein
MKYRCYLEGWPLALFVRGFLTLMLLATVAGCSSKPGDVSDGLEAIGEATEHSVVFQEASDHDLYFARVSGNSVDSTQISRPQEEIPMALSPNGKKVAYYAPSQGGRSGNGIIHVKRKGGTILGEYQHSELEKMIASVSKPNAVNVVRVLDLEWVSQNNDMLGVHAQITSSNREIRGAVGFTIDTADDRADEQIESLSGRTSQKGFESFDWSPTNADSIAVAIGSDVTLVEKSASLPSGTSLSNSASPAWGRTGVSVIRNGDVQTYRNGTFQQVTSTPEDETDVAVIPVSGGNDVVFWLREGSVHYTISDGSDSSVDEGIEVPLGDKRIAQFDVGPDPN